MKQNNSELTKTKLKHQRLEEIKNSTKVLNYEFLGNMLIVISGILPFVHVAVPDVPLEDKIFGYTSVHRFLYSVGTHISLLFVSLGVFIVLSILNNGIDSSQTIKNLRLSFYSPFISAVFFVSWVFVPQINYNMLAYLFFGVLVLISSLLVLKRLKEYLKYLKENHTYKEMILNEGLEFVSRKIKSDS